MLKTCSRCNDLKPIDEFHRQKSQLDGHRPMCKSCVSDYMKTYRLANLESEKAKSQEWRLRNIERVKANRKLQYQRTRQKAIAEARRWALENPGKRRANALRYVKSEKGAATKLRHRYTMDKPTELWAKVLRQDPCCYCGDPSGTLDHIVPQALGGTHEWDNLSGACRSCNSKKHDLSLLHALIRRSGYAS